MMIAGTVSLAIGVALLGYVGYAILEGTIRLASRTTNTLVSFSLSPLAFLIGASIYSLGGAVMVWAGIRMLKPK
jgi:NhaP-type Na+/H+ or K+/H+ antiporter